ncbi:MAG: hypothetical protein MRZ79_09245 [Bacteroidia bacterium]|nr:hypothetical protein [Bacteroidia bacterium]
MKTKLIFLSMATIFLLNACSKYSYWDISEFNMDSNALENNEEIKLIYSSNGPNDNKERTYYYHIIVVSQKSGDTVNVLTTLNHGFNRKDMTKIFHFFNEDHPASKLLQMDLKDLANLKSIDNSDRPQTKKIMRVARDPNFDHIAQNSFPTIIGTIGNLSIEKGE